MGTYIFLQLFGKACKLCVSEDRHAIRRVSIIQPSLFYASLRIS